MGSTAECVRGVGVRGLGVGGDKAGEDGQKGESVCVCVYVCACVHACVCAHSCVHESLNVGGMGGDCIHVYMHINVWVSG